MMEAGLRKCKCHQMKRGYKIITGPTNERSLRQGNNAAYLWSSADRFGYTKYFEEKTECLETCIAARIPRD